MIALGNADARGVVSEALTEASVDTWTAVVDVVMAVARRCEEALDRIEDDSQELQAAATGYTSSPQRRTMGRLRAELFRIGETQAAQRDLLDVDEELAQTMGREHHRLIARAATAFGANHSMTTRLYAMLGDVLSEQDSVVSERLTLVATIFLPLTLVTGFFGMNFQWMVDGLGSLPAFIVLGILVPAAMTVATLLLIRRLTRSA
jgi:Mg2+ and Co2+ transporter CorA